MKVAFITPVTPYKENMGGPSGHPYHLMIERPEGISIDVYSFNDNNLSAETIGSVEKELHVKIHLVRNPSWKRWMFKLHLTFIRLFLKYPVQYYVRLPKFVVEKIKSSKPDLVWLYCQEFSGISRQLAGIRRLHTLPDCYSLHWYRRLGCRFTLQNAVEFWKCVINYRKHYRMERDYYVGSDIVYHLVGQADVDFLKEINPGIDVRFVHHPHYETGISPRVISFHKPIRLLVAGCYDFYMKEAADDLIMAMLDEQVVHSLMKNYELTFLGKGWEKHVVRMQAAGYRVSHIKFAPDYNEELSKHDVQITPISIGTGTKGKVLDAIANGLLVIGTPYALENIAVENGESCVEYHSSKEAVDILRDITNNVQKYEEMAERGREAVLTEHSRKRVAAQLFGL